MSILYISDSDTKIGFVDNRVVATYPDGMEHSLPVESVESITLLTKVQISTKCVELVKMKTVSESIVCRERVRFINGGSPALSKRKKLSCYKGGFL